MRRARLLVVDDEPDIVDLLRLLLAEHEVRTAPSAADALALLPTFAVDLLVTDVKMPKMSGLALVAEVRKLAPGLPVLLVTGHRGPPAAAELPNCWWLPKPFRADALRAAVAAALAGGG